MAKRQFQCSSTLPFPAPLPHLPLQLRLAALKREEEAVKAEEERLNGEKLRHVRLLKRIRDEECSRFGNLRVLANRYQLLSLLGKGGFSEVYKVRGQLPWGKGEEAR